MNLTFKPIARGKERRPAMVSAPTRDMARAVSANLEDFIGLGVLLAIGKIAKSMALPPKRQAGRGNINPRKQLNPSTAFLPS